MLTNLPSSNKPAMNKLFKILCFAAASLMLITPSMAQNRVATTAAQFLTLGTGARGMALGHAYTAQATGGDALFWNPGGAAIPHEGGTLGSVFFTNTQGLVDVNYNAFAVTIPITQTGVLGASIGMLDYGRMDVRTVDRPEGVGQTFGAKDIVVGVSYAQPLTDAFYIGGTVKAIQQTIWDMRAQTMAVDIGFVLQTNYFNGLRVAASIMNFGGKMQMAGINNQVFIDFDPTGSGSNDAIPARIETSRWDLPLSFRFGLAMPLYRSEYATLELYSDAHQTNDNDLNSDLGAQLRLSVRRVHLDARVGYKDLGVQNVDNHLAFGTGLNLHFGSTGVGFDYAYVPFDLLGNTQTFDVRIFF